MLQLTIATTRGTKALQQYHYATADMHTLAANSQLNCHPLWKYVEMSIPLEGED
jgi:hypothetical protein